MGKFIINYKMEFKTRPTKQEVEGRLWDLIAQGFTLRSVEENDYYTTTKELKQKNEKKTDKKR
tara:strand:+ start:2222 stop:2410 length:189 start_codon:yes stop_codon:yes gene_type:complete